MNNPKLKIEVCPFCEKDMKVEDIYQTSKVHAVIVHKCECGWEDTTNIELYK